MGNKHMSFKQRLFVALGLVVTLAFLWFAFSRLDPTAVLVNIRSAHPLPILIGAVWYFSAVAVISLRWGSLLRAIQPVPLTKLMPLVSIGYMGNNVYPFRSGEILRIWLLQRNHGIPLARSATTVIVERIFDGLVMLTFIFVALLLLDTPSPEVRTIASVTAPLFLIALAVFFVLAARPNLLRQVAAFVGGLLPGKLGGFIAHLTEDFIAGMGGLRSPTDLAATVFFSYACWLLEASVYWIVTFAFDLNLTYLQMLLVVGVVNLAGLLPASPGQWGVFEFFVSTVLIAEGAPADTALAYALVVHMVIWLPVTLLGFYFLVRQGLNLGALTRARELEATDPAHPTEQISSTAEGHP
jgi:hypothetical protein